MTTSEREREIRAWIESGDPLNNFHAKFLLAQLDEARKVLKVTAIALAEPSGGEFWSARKLADEWGIYNDDLEGSRVLLRLTDRVLKEGK